MSTLKTDKLVALGGMGGSIQITPDSALSGADAGSIRAPGSVIQSVLIKSHNRTTYSAAYNTNGTTITDLNLTITPKSTSSLIMIEYSIFCEVTHDTVWLMHRGGSLIGYNTDAGNNYWSGLSANLYDGDNSTTPWNCHLIYFDRPGTTSAVTYAPAFRPSNGNTFTLALNRSLNSVGTSGQENGVSIGVAMEIAQ